MCCVLIAEQKEIEKHASAAVGEKEKKQSRKEQKEMEKHADAVVEQKDKKQSKRERKGIEKDAITEIVEKDKNQLKSDLGASRKDQVKNTYENQKLSKKIKPNSGDDEEPHFWEPLLGSRWDFDDGKDRWDLNTNSADKADDGRFLGGASMFYILVNIVALSSCFVFLSIMFLEAVNKIPREKRGKLYLINLLCFSGRYSGVVQLYYLLVIQLFCCKCHAGFSR